MKGNAVLILITHSLGELDVLVRLLAARNTKYKAKFVFTVERFNRNYRDEILDLSLFRSLTEVRDLTRSWMKKYNQERPHDALGDLSPAEYLGVKSGAETSNYVWS